MLRGRRQCRHWQARRERRSSAKGCHFGLVTGVVSAISCTGSGCLIAPGVVAAGRTPIPNSSGTAFVVVTAIGLTTTVNYAWSGLVDWPLASTFISGELAGNAGRLATMF